MRIKSIFLLFFCLIAFVQCNDNDDYYDDPSWLEGPLYSVLQEKGNFTSYLKCVDRTLLAPVIKEGGYYTVFAPNDNAFAAFLEENGYSSVDEIPDEIVGQIVSYSLVYSRFPLSRLGDIFVDKSYTNYTNVDDEQYLQNVGMKKQSTYYNTVYRDPEFNNNWVIDQSNSSGGYYVGSSTSTQPLDPPYKYIPIITSGYVDRMGLDASDYTSFFRNSVFSSTNVQDASVVVGEGADYDGMRARNGIAHEIDKVILPLGNIDKYLSSETQYAGFKELLDFQDVSGSYVFKNYLDDQDVAEFYKTVYPDYGIEKLYVKSYSREYLAFSPADEWYWDYDTSTENWFIEVERNGYTMFVPTADALNRYIKERVLKYTDDLHDMPIEAVTSLINAHIATELVWPSQFKTAQNSTGEYINGEGETGGGIEVFNVKDQKMASNGFIYTIDYVIKSKLFETVYSEIFLNPAYSWLNSAFLSFYENSIREDLMTSAISGDPNSRYTVLMLSNDLLSKDGYSYVEGDGFSNSLLLSGTVDLRLQQLMRMHIFKGYNGNGIDTEIHSFDAGDPDFYNGWQFRVSLYGDVVRFKDGKIQAAGNIDDGTHVEVAPVEAFDNGTAYEITNGEILQFSPRWTSASTEAGWRSKTLMEAINEAADANNEVNLFRTFVREALLLEDGSLDGVSEDNVWTVLMPTTNYMNTAIRYQLIPASTQINANDVNKNKAAAFIKGHFLQGRMLPDDGLNYLYPYNSIAPNTDLIPTALRITDENVGLINSRTYVSVSKSADGYLLIQPNSITESGNILVTTINTNLNDLSGTSSEPNNEGFIYRAPVSGQTDIFKSNRMTGNAVLHQLNGYISYEVVYPE